MEFCEKCGSIITLQNGKAVCAGCGKKTNKRLRIKAEEKIENNKVIAIIKEESSNTNPIVDVKCQKCKNKKAYFWTMQTRSSDESETKFYKCTSCKHTWRKYR
jgi:transcription factor S